MKMIVSTLAFLAMASAAHASSLVCTVSQGDTKVKEISEEIGAGNVFVGGGYGDSYFTAKASGSTVSMTISSKSNLNNSASGEGQNGITGTAFDASLGAAVTFECAIK